MDGENNGKPYFKMDDLGIPSFLETPIWLGVILSFSRKLTDVHFSIVYTCWAFSLFPEKLGFQTVPHSAISGPEGAFGDVCSPLG